MATFKINYEEEEQNKFIDNPEEQKIELEDPAKILVPLNEVYYNKNSHQIRRNKAILFGNLLMQYEIFQKWDYATKTAFITKLERSIYNMVIDKAKEENIITSWEINDFVMLYNTLCYKISSNIEKGGMVNNPHLAIKLLQNEIKLKDLPRMPSAELYPEKYNDINKRIEMSKNVQQTVKYSSLYICRKCKGGKTKYEILQNRSADEGNNYTVTCLTCRYQFHA